MSAAAVERDGTTAYQQPVDELLVVLGTDARRGLGGAEAQERLEKYGRSELTAEESAGGMRGAGQAQAEQFAAELRAGFKSLR